MELRQFSTNNFFRIKRQFAKSFRAHSYEKCACKSFRIHSYEKGVFTSTIESYSYRKGGGGGGTAHSGGLSSWHRHPACVPTTTVRSTGRPKVGLSTWPSEAPTLVSFTTNHGPGITSDVLAVGEVGAYPKGTP